MADLPLPPSAISAGRRSVDPWREMRAATPARIGLGRTGDTMPLSPVLAFQSAHADARDAVHTALDVEAVQNALTPHRVLVVRSAARDRSEYLRRPDLGRRLDADSSALLKAEAGRARYDCLFVIADGLSAQATARHAAPLIERCLARLTSRSVAPLVIATQARVALGDEIGALLGARLCAVLIGERPGLSVADSLGIYLTFDPQPGRRNSERNCISNIHARGLDYDRAADKLCWLIEQALLRQVTGVALKEEEGYTPDALIAAGKQLA